MSRRRRDHGQDDPHVGRFVTGRSALRHVHDQDQVRCTGLWAARDRGRGGRRRRTKLAPGPTSLLAQAEVTKTDLPSPDEKAAIESIVALDMRRLDIELLREELQDLKSESAGH